MFYGIFSQKQKRSFELYENLISDLSPAEINSLKLDTYPRDGIDNVAKLIRECKWQQAALINHFPIYALLALKENKINGMEFSTTQMFLFGV